eukprot:CAMPEP_0117499782 /NCGR_PEP_ID=MMETSP0784-20121206/22423_1 /TAXON_ID=39447 /ORGANISM="" /LENGTH=561 /DNA_ID=CAMNT_0005294941 /DNA_START=85 /DNA_END=1767 /DNA_ORIENTATION=+
MVRAALHPPPASVDVLVLGGGPTGLSLLAELLHHDACGRHALVDANLEPCGGSRLPKGQGILASTLELWSRWGDGLLPEQVGQQRLLPKHILPIFNSWDSCRGCPGPTPEPQRADPVLTAWGNGNRVPQALYEGVLRQHVKKEIAIAGARSGGTCAVSTHFGWRVVDLRRDTRGWAVDLVPHKGCGIAHYAASTEVGPSQDLAAGVDVGLEDLVTVRAETIVGCDGGRSFVRKALGIKLAGIGALGKMLSPLFRSPSLYEQLRQQFDGSPEGMFYCFKKSGGPSAFIGVVATDTFFGQVLYDSQSEVPPDILQAWEGGDQTRLAQLAVQELENRCDCSFAWEVEPLEGYLWTPYNLCADRWMAEDCSAFIAGDAAHLLSPAGAFGMNGGVADAVNLGWKLAARQSGMLGERGSTLEREMLASYQVERERAWHRYSAYQQKAISEDRQVGRRESGAPYELASLGPSSRTPIVGERGTDVILSSGRRLHSLLAGCRGYTLVLLGSDSSAEACADRFRAATAHVGSKAAVHYFGDAEVELHRVYRDSPGSPLAFVFRPDQVLAW